MDFKACFKSNLIFKVSGTSIHAAVTLASLRIPTEIPARELFVLRDFKCS